MLKKLSRSYHNEKNKYDCSVQKITVFSPSSDAILTNC